MDAPGAGPGRPEGKEVGRPASCPPHSSRGCLSEAPFHGTVSSTRALGAVATVLPVSHLQGAPLTLRGVGLAPAPAGLRPATWPRATDPEKEPAATSHLEKALRLCARGQRGSWPPAAVPWVSSGGSLLRVGLRFQLSVPSWPPPPPARPLELCLGAQQQMGLISALALKGPDVEKCQNKLEALPSPRLALWPERQ